MQTTRTRKLKPQAPSSNKSTTLDPKPISTADRILQERADREFAEQSQITDAEEYRRALNMFASSENGLKVIRPWLKYMGWAEAPPSNNQMLMIERNGMRRFYVTLIRPFLDPETRAKIENV